jgi:hypothetical protein
MREYLAVLDRPSRLLLCGTAALSAASFAVAANGLPGVA